jgi:hypothetical protein
LEGQGGEVAGERAQIEQRLAAAQQLVAERRGELVTRQLAPLPLARGVLRRRAAADRRRGPRGGDRRAPACDRGAGRARPGRVAELNERRAKALADGAECRAAAEAARVLGDESVALQADGRAEAGQLEEEAQRLLAAIAEANRTLSPTTPRSRRPGRARRDARRASRHRAGADRARMALDRLATQLAERYGLTPDALADVRRWTPTTKSATGGRRRSASACSVSARSTPRR